MKRNVRLVKDVQTSAGKMDMYVITSRKASRQHCHQMLTREGELLTLHGWSARNGEDITMYMANAEFETLPVVTLEVQLAG
jgi:hypothetical protein